LDIKILIFNLGLTDIKGEVMFRKVFLVSVLLMVVFCSSNFVYSAEVFEGAIEALNLDREEFKGAVVGGGVLTGTSPYKGVDNNVYAVPIVVIRYKKFYMDGKSFGYILNNDENMEFSIVGKPRIMGYEAGDSADLAGMDSRDISFDGGLRGVFKNDLGRISVTWLADLLNNHQGQEASVVYSKVFKDGMFTPRIGFKWMSKDLVDYYFGVKGNEVKTTRADYEGDSAINLVTGFALAVPVGDNWAVTFDFSYELLNSQIKDSPIVDESGLFSYLAGVIYRF